MRKEGKDTHTHIYTQAHIHANRHAEVSVLNALANYINNGLEAGIGSRVKNGVYQLMSV